MAGQENLSLCPTNLCLRRVYVLIRRKTAVYVVSALAALILLYFLYLVRVRLARVISPFVIAIFISYILMPFIAQIEKRDIPRWAAILLTYIILAAFVVAALAYVIPEIVANITELIITLPEYAGLYTGKTNELLLLFQAGNYPEDLKRAIFFEIQNGVEAIQNKAVEGLKGALKLFMGALYLAFDFAIGLVVAFYMMRDSKKLKKSILGLFPVKWRGLLTSFFSDIDRVLANFIQGQLIVALTVGALETAGLSIAGVRYAFVLGAVGGISNIIPYFGPIIGSVPAVMVAFLQSPLKAVWAAAVFIMVQQIDNAFLTPKIIGGTLGLHPLMVILAVVVGQEFFGIAGMLFAVPAMGIIKAVCYRIIEMIA